MLIVLVSLVGNSLSSHDYHIFTTKDRDNDDFSKNCAQTHHGAWWYTACHQANLNGDYLGGAVARSRYSYGVVWQTWKGYFYSLKTTEMKIRPAD